MPSVDSIPFDTTGLIPQGDKNGVRIWQHQKDIVLVYSTSPCRLTYWQT
jgi:hypothetical protein